MKAELQQLIILQKTDSEIKKLEAELNQIPERRAAIEQEFEQRAVSFRDMELKRDEAHAARLGRDTELQLLREQLERAERNLMKSQTGDEYTAAIREADAARKQISTTETQILENLETIEKSETELATHAPEIERLRAEMEAKLKDFEIELEQQTAQLASARARREELMQTLPKQTTALYTRIASRIRDGRALAEARNGSCMACLMRLRPQAMAEVRRGEDIVMCDNCNRILYFVPVEQATQKAVPMA